MLIKILYIILAGIIIKMADFIPFETKIGDVQFGGQLSSPLIMSIIIFTLLAYFSNFIYYTKQFISKLKTRRNARYERTINKSIILECAKKLCGNHSKIKNYDKNNILHHVILFMNQDNNDYAKKLDQYSETSVFTSIFLAKKYLAAQNYKKAQTHLEYLHAVIGYCEWTFEQLYSCYIENEDFENCLKLINVALSKGNIEQSEFENKKANLMLQRYNSEHKVEDIENAIATSPAHLQSIQKYINVFKQDDDKILLAIEKFWQHKPSLTLGFLYYSKLTLLTSHKLEKMQNLVQNFPNHKDALILKCYAANKAELYNITNTMLANLYKQDSLIANILKLQMNIQTKFTQKAVADMIENIISNRQS